MTDETSKAKEEVTEEVKETPPQDAGEKVPEKISLTQKELDGKLADARRKAEATLKETQKKYDELLSSPVLKPKNKPQTKPPPKRWKPCERIYPNRLPHYWTNSRQLSNSNGLKAH